MFTLAINDEIADVQWDFTISDLKEMTGFDLK